MKVSIKTMEDYLPQELIEETLCKLPVKSILRFICVCKSWHSLVKSGSFVSKHLINNNNNGSDHQQPLVQVAENCRFYARSRSHVGDREEFSYRMRIRRKVPYRIYWNRGKFKACTWSDMTSAAAPKFNISHLHQRGASAEGFVYFLAIQNHSVVALQFDASHEVFRSINQPKKKPDGSMEWLVPAYGETKIALFRRQVTQRNSATWEVRVLKDPGGPNSWAKLYNFGEEVRLEEPLRLVRNGILVMKCYGQDGMDMEIISFDPKSKQYLKICDSENNAFVDYYVQSLELLEVEDTSKKKLGKKMGLMNIEVNVFLNS